MPSSGFTRITDLPGASNQRSNSTPSPSPTQATTSSVQSFQNKRLPGVGTGALRGAQQDLGSPSAQLLSMRRPQTGVELSARRTTAAVKSTNKRLMDLAQQAGARRQQQLQKQQQGVGQGSGLYQPGQQYGGTPAYRPTTQGQGRTVDRISGILRNFPGLRITEVGGNREYDRRNGVPRHANSYHYDTQNPAVDIGGSTAQLHRLYRQLVAMGGWRQILWQSPGHYDHIHIA
jgi:hypothetical protein